MLTLAEKDMVNTIFEYAKFCLLVANDDKGYDDVYKWAKESHIPLEKVSKQKKIRYYTFLHNKNLFWLQESLINILKKLKRSAK